MPKHHLAALVLCSCLTFTCLAQAGPPSALDKEVKQLTPLDDRWRFSIGLPAWIAASTGDTAINGVTRHSNTGFGEIVNKIEMVAALRAEASKGRFGILADFSYFTISDGVGAEGVVKKVDIQADQLLGDLGVRWRLVESDRGWVDLLAGVRYTYLHEHIDLQGNDAAITAAANRLALAGTLVRLRVAEELLHLRAQDPSRFNKPPLGAGEAERLRREIERVRGNTASAPRGLRRCCANG